MSPSVKILIAVILAGIAGTVANAIAASIAIAPDKINFLYVPNRYLVAIAIAALLPVLYTQIGGMAGWALSFVALTTIPSLVAKLILGAGAPWDLVLALNAIYAITAIAIYRAIVGRA